MKDEMSIYQTQQQILLAFHKATGEIPLSSLAMLCRLSEAQVLRVARGGTVYAAQWNRAYPAMMKYLAMEQTLKSMSDEELDKIFGKGKEHAKAKG